MCVWILRITPKFRTPLPKDLASSFAKSSVPAMGICVCGHTVSIMPYPSTCKVSNATNNVRHFLYVSLVEMFEIEMSKM